MKLDIQMFATYPANISITATSITLGGSATITLTPHQSTNRYRLILQMSGYSTTLVDNLSRNTYTFQPSIDLANYITNNPSANATIVCETYYGNTSVSSSLIGRTTKAIVLNVPVNSSTKPTISISSIEEGNSTMTSLNWGVYVQNHSQLKVNFSSSGKYNATIKKIQITADSKTYSYDYNDASISTNKTTDIITTSGSQTITVYAIDSRGYTNSITSDSLTINAYESPKITETKVERTGTNNATLKYTFKGSITNVGSNAHTFKIGYKLRSASTYTDSTLVDNAYTINKVDQTMSWTLSADNTYDIRFVALDSFYTSSNPVIQTKELSSDGDLINYHQNGKAMAIGKVSEAGSNEKLLEVALPTTISEKVTSSKDITAASLQGKTWDYSTADTTNTWVPVSTSNGWRHRAIPTDYNNAPSTLSVGTASKLGSSNVGTATKPIYLNGGTPTAGTQIEAAGYRGVKTRTSKGNLGWGTNNTYVPDLGMLAYWDGAYSGTNSNLTYAHQGTIQCKPTSLYDNSSGTEGNITLSETSANFNYLEIFYFWKDDSACSCEKVYSPNGKKLRLTNSYDNGTYLYTTTATYTISGTSLTRNSAIRWRFAASTAAQTRTTNADNIKIYKVVGYK